MAASNATNPWRNVAHILGYPTTLLLGFVLGWVGPILVSGYLPSPPFGADVRPTLYRKLNCTIYKIVFNSMPNPIGSISGQIQVPGTIATFHFYRAEQENSVPGVYRAVLHTLPIRNANGHCETARESMAVDAEMDTRRQGDGTLHFSAKDVGAHYSVVGFVAVDGIVEQPADPSQLYGSGTFAYDDVLHQPQERKFEMTVDPILDEQ